MCRSTLVSGGGSRATPQCTGGADLLYWLIDLKDSPLLDVLRSTPKNELEMSGLTLLLYWLIQLAI